MYKFKIMSKTGQLMFALYTPAAVHGVKRWTAEPPPPLLGGREQNPIKFNRFRRMSENITSKQVTGDVISVQCRTALSINDPYSASLQS